MTTEEKIEELRRRIESACKTFENPGDDYEKGKREVYHTLRYYMNNEFFPPPRKGTWGFFYIDDMGARRLWPNFRSRDDAERERASRPSYNPSPVIFIEEPTCAK